MISMTNRWANVALHCSRRAFSMGAGDVTAPSGKHEPSRRPCRRSRRRRRDRRTRRGLQSGGAPAARQRTPRPGETLPTCARCHRARRSDAPTNHRFACRAARYRCQPPRRQIERHWLRPAIRYASRSFSSGSDSMRSVSMVCSSGARMAVVTADHCTCAVHGLR
jgi:hypothetical protein